MPLFALLLAVLPTAAAEGPAPPRLTKAAALRQVAVHVCLTSLAEGAPLAELDACVENFSREVVVDDDGACARHGVLGERLVRCQGAVADYFVAESVENVRAALLAAIRVRGRCLASELCPQHEPRPKSFRRSSRPSPQTP